MLSTASPKAPVLVSLIDKSHEPKESEENNMLSTPSIKAPALVSLISVIAVAGVAGVATLWISQNVKLLDPSLPITRSDSRTAAPSYNTAKTLTGQPSERLAAALDTLRDRIGKDGNKFVHPMQPANSSYSGIRLAMLNAINQDPALRDRLFETFKQDPNSLLGDELATVLSATGAPTVQTAAMDMALNASKFNTEQRAAALFVLAEMDAINGTTRDRLLTNVNQEKVSALRQFTLMALKSAPSTQADRQRIQQVLSTTATTDADKHVRRHAAHQIGKWATSDADLAPLRTMALQEQDVNARARAIMSIADSGYKTDANKAVLLKAVNNKVEPAPVRQYVWNALNSYPLTDVELAGYDQAGEQIKQAVAEYKRQK